MRIIVLLYSADILYIFKLILYSWAELDPLRVPISATKLLLQLVYFNEKCDYKLHGRKNFRSLKTAFNKI